MTSIRACVYLCKSSIRSLTRIYDTSTNSKILYLIIRSIFAFVTSPRPNFDRRPTCQNFWRSDCTDRWATFRKNFFIVTEILTVMAGFATRLRKSWRQFLRKSWTCFIIRGWISNFSQDSFLKFASLSEIKLCARKFLMDNGHHWNKHFWALIWIEMNKIL